MRRLPQRFVAFSAACALLAAAAVGAAAAAAERAVLVVGNAAYAHSAPLANPGNDARAVGGAGSFGRMVLDACRDNPFAQRTERTGATRSIGRGLGRVEPTSGSVTVAYAACDGTTAADGDGCNSPYTRALLRHVAEPELVGEMFNKVAESVLTRTGRVQEPVVYGRLPPGAHFAPPRGAPVVSVPRPLDRTERQAFRDCADCPMMEVIPAGQFRMGCEFDNPGKRCLASEFPVREVRIGRPFALGRHEVTFAQWDACAVDGGCGGYRPVDRGWGRGDRPVMNVSWEDAQSYAAWLSRRTGRTYRLPSEAEWEYAVRGSTEATSTRFSWGDGIRRDQANYCGSCDSQWPEDEDPKSTAPVGSFAPNGFGLYDMHGNVYEWTEDCWNRNYEGAPSDGRAWLAGDCAERVLRGGSWMNWPMRLRAAIREKGPGTGHRVDTVGFRVARTLTP